MKNLCILAFLWIATTSFAQTPCGSEKHDQFDFWLGEWTVYHTDADTIVGQNTITRTLNDCVVEENWKSVSGFEGKSFNTYDPQSKTWKQVWVDVGGNTYQFKGEMKDGNMVMTGSGYSEGRSYLFEMTYFPRKNGEVRQLWKARIDEDQDWLIWFDGIYRKTGN